jgi:limonene-1,2-epoxide hydrolase
MTMENVRETGVEVSNRRSAQEVVEAFLSALERLDLDAAESLAAPNIRWVNVPWKSATDKAGFTKVLRGMFKGAKRFEVQYSDIHERGDGVVYTDRVDIFEGGGMSMHLPVQGEFHVKDGLITEWVDRFSWAKVIGDIGRSLPGIIKYRLGR